MKEVWKDVVGYEGHYKVSNLGRVKSLKNGEEKILKEVRSGNYYTVSLCINGKPAPTGIHRIVGMAFIPNPHNKPQINHISGIKSDNTVCNLEWVTPKENMQHSVRIGSHVSPACKGEKQGSSKLKENDVLQIRSIFTQKFFTFKEVAKAYNVSVSCIEGIQYRYTWKHI